MMRHALILSVALSFGLVGCTLRPGSFVALPTTSGGSVGAEATTAPTEGQASTAVSSFGTLQLAIRWPERPSGYQTALIPSSTNTLAVKVASGSTVLGETYVSRVGNETTSTATMSLHTGNNLSLQVLAYREAAPVPNTAEPIARYDGNVNIAPSQKTTATIQLSPMIVPTITGLSTNVAVAGDYVTITGTNFATDSTIPLVVDFNGYLSNEVTRLGPNSVRAKLPPGVPTGRVMVKSDGVSSSSNWVMWVPSSLQLSSVKENWDPTSSSERLLMFGNAMQFTATPTWTYKVGDSINYGTPPVPSWLLSNTNAGTIDATGLFTATRSYQVTGVSASLGSLSSATQSVKLVADAPVISGITPTNGGMSSSLANGPKTVVTINGSGFGDGENATLKVFLGSTEITDFTRVSDAQITFQLPSSGLQTSMVKVVSYGVTSANKPTFQVLQSLSLSPTGITLNVPLGGTQQYSVSGTDTAGNAVASPSVTWASSATASATVSQTGLLTAVGYGTANPIVQSGNVQAWGATANIDYDYTVQSGTGNSSNAVSGTGTPLYYSQSFSTTQSRTFKALDVGVVPTDNSSLSLEVRSDSGGYPSGTVIAERTASYQSSLSGHVYAFSSPVTLPAGNYHLVYKLPANQDHYLYWFVSGGTGVGKQSVDGAAWGAITTVPPNNPNSLFFRLGE